MKRSENLNSWDKMLKVLLAGIFVIGILPFYGGGSVGAVTSLPPSDEDFETSSGYGESPRDINGWSFRLLNENEENQNFDDHGAFIDIYEKENNHFIALEGPIGLVSTVQIKSISGTGFNLNSFKIKNAQNVTNIGTVEGFYKILGYKGGHAVQGASLDFTAPATEFSTINLEGESWGNIDEFRIVAQDGSADIALEFDDLTVSEPLVPITITSGESYTFESRFTGYGFYVDGYSVGISKPEGTLLQNTRVELSGGDETVFTLGTIPSDTLASSTNSVSFMVRPKTGLQPGTYTETLTVLADGAISDSMTLTFTVNPHPPSTLSIEPETVDFGQVLEGYSTIEKIQVSIIKEGHVSTEINNIYASFAKADSVFSINTRVPSFSIGAGESSIAAHIDVKKNLLPGIYTDTLTFTSDNSILEEIQLKFEVIDVHTVLFYQELNDVYSTQHIKDGELVETLSPPEKTGYTFNNWYLDQVGNTLFNIDSPILQDTNVYAIWDANEYTISFTENGGSNVKDQTVLYNDLAVEPAHPTRSGYRFAGWYSDESLQTVFTFEESIQGDLELFARWSPLNSSPPTPAPPEKNPNVEEIVVDVTDGSNGGTVVQTPITRETLENGTKKDTVTLTMEKADEFISKTQNKVASIVIPDVEDSVVETTASIPLDAINTLAENEIAVQINTRNVIVDIPASSLVGFDEDIYFRLIPVKGEVEKEKIEERAKQEELVRETTRLDGAVIDVLGRPMTIETNLQSRQVQLMLPIEDALPQDEEFREMILNGLVVFIEHSDGSKEVVHGEVVKGENGDLFIQFTVDKFSTFTLVYVEQEESVIPESHKPYISGFKDGTFRPDVNVTRAQMALMLAKNLELPTSKKETQFKDVPATHYAAGAISSVYDAGLMVGEKEDAFSPEGWIKRGEMAAIIDRWVKKQCEGDIDSYPFCGAESNVSYKDVPNSFWAVNEIEANAAYGIMQGFNNGTFRPDEYLKRDQAVKVLNRLFKREPHVDGLTVQFTDVPVDHWAFEEIAEASMEH